MEYSDQVSIMQDIRKGHNKGHCAVIFLTCDEDHQRFWWLSGLDKG